MASGHRGGDFRGDQGSATGVNIAVQNTDIGTTTDLYGQYVLDGISPQDILTFTYIGYQVEEVAIDGRGVIDVVLTPQALSGEDVVVIGYGTMQRRDITSSIFSLKEGSFTQGNNTDLQTMLQGRVPGVVITGSSGDLGAEPLIRIRGGTSISAGNGPLIVIDGVPIDYSSGTPDGVTGGQEVTGGNRDNPLSMVNPYDIASIDILKDASAAAIYGARGGNGVILITTKQGKPGGLTLTYDTYTSMSSPSKILDLFNAAEYRKFAADVGATPEMGAADTDTDWQDAIFRTAVSQSHNLAFGGGTQLSQYRVSLNYLDEQGIVLNSARQRYSLRINVNHKMLDEKLRLALRINPSFIRRNNTPYNQQAGFYGGTFTNVFKMNPTFPVKNDDGSYYEYATSGIRNPVALLEEIKDISEDMRIFFNGTAEYEFVPGLTGKINLGWDRTSTNRGTYEPTTLPYTAAYGGRADVRNNSRQAVLFEPTVNYKTDIGGSQLQATAGYTFQEFDNTGFGAVSRDYVVDSWSYYNLGGGADFTEAPFSYRDKNRLISYLGRVNVTIADRILASAAVRREGSSRFGSENEWGLFPSASVGYRVTDDLKVRASWGVTGNQDIGNYRSLVILGSGDNAVIGDKKQTGIGPTQLPNADLKWEETSQLNLGVDFNLYRDRLSGSVDVYTKTTEDLLLETDVPQPAVTTTMMANTGSVENKGIELTLNTVNISTPDFFWRTSFNFAMNKNEVVSLGERDLILTGDVGGSGLSDVPIQIIKPGELLGTFYGYPFLGYDDVTGEEILTNGVWDKGESFTDNNENGVWDPKEEYTDANGSGVWDIGEPFTDSGDMNGVWDDAEPLDERRILGNAQPDFTFGISSIINYKNIDFRVFIQGVQGFDIFNNTRLEYQRPANITTSINMFAGVVDDVADGLDPNAGVTYTDRFIEDGSFIRLQNVTLGYTFNTAQVKNLRLYVSADNLFILTKYTGYDPEVNTYTGVALGVDYTNYPKARTFTVGLSIGL